MTDFATLRNFTKGSRKGSAKHLDSAFEQVAKALAGSGETGQVQIRVVGERRPRHFCLTLTAKRCTLAVRASKRPDLELVAREETALKILDGSLSPLEAFLRGKMRIRGDAALGKRLLRRVAASSEARFEICEIGV